MPSSTIPSKPIDMKSNEFFNMKRFGLLVKHDLMINQNKYLLKMLVLFLGLYAFMCYFMMNSPYSYCIQYWDGHKHEPAGYIQLFVFGLMALGVFVGGSFSDLGSKVKRTSFILLPASTFEKILQPFLLRVVLGIIIYVLFFLVDAHLARMTVANAPSIVIKGLVIEPFGYVQLIDAWGRDNSEQVVFALFSIGMYLFTIPLFFKKQALLKAIFAFFVGIFVYIFFFILLSHLFHPGVYDWFNYTVPDYKIYKDIRSFDFLMNSIVCVSWVFLLFLGYIKLKELKL
jgi:hypothetical protein